MTPVTGQAQGRRIRSLGVATLIIAVTGAAAFGFIDAPAASRLPMADSTVVIAGGPFEPSGVAHIPGSNYVLFVDDGRDHEILLMELAKDGRQLGTPIPIPLGVEVRDMEGITSDGRYFYVVGSQSKKTGHAGDGLVRFTFDLATRRVQNLERVEGLKAWLAEHVAELRGTANRIGDDVLNIEGLAWDSANRRLLLGLRAPLVGGKALVVPIKLRDSARALSRQNLRADGQALRLDLGGGGVRSLEYDAGTATFQVISGATLDTEARDFQVLQWSGNTAEAPRQVATFSRNLKPEGFARASIGGRSVGIFVFDVGRFAIRE